MIKLGDVFPERRLRRIRLGAGLIIFIFVVTHLINHTLGLISLSWAESGRRIFASVWRNPVGTAALYGALSVHVILTMRSLYIKRSLVMPLAEAGQIVLGLAIPMLLIQHIVATRIASEFYDYADTYHSVVTSLWINSPENGIQQVATLFVVWMHGCIGLHFWLRYRNWYSAWSSLLLTLALLIPILSILGFVEMGRTLADPLYAAETTNSSSVNRGFFENRTAQQELQMIREALYLSFGGCLLAIAALRAHRSFQDRLNQVAIHYQSGETVRVPRGYTILEASRQGGIAHYSACGGKGRCSTCRVQILKGLANLADPDKHEEATLKRINASGDVRLACQVRPKEDITVAPLLVPSGESVLLGAREDSPGREREIAVLFCDLRNFTTIASNRLPFDTVFLLNRYFEIVGKMVAQEGGRLDKFIGDGAMALFGLDVSIEEGCRRALRAATAIEAEVTRMSGELLLELKHPLRVAIGIHAGPAVVGTIGYGAVRNLTAIGDTVNVASRLENVAKELDASAVFSEEVAKLAGADMDLLEAREIHIRGRADPLKVYIVPPRVPERSV
ncbi:adenylate/guanylate cyclase domain-containing protein [Oryzifoliimicrobium ureilyticus]|uniref:adenylate/guanylate cyclase domain-containing protein n=1 Tax=Oryzifoliimicrobium ureilyticus TaxID=3113724 RepID=UPI0030764ACE